MAENKMAEILVEQAYEKVRQDLALRLLDEINQIDIYGTDEYEHGANFAMGEVVDIIRRLAGVSNGRK